MTRLRRRSLDGDDKSGEMESSKHKGQVVVRSTNDAAAATTRLKQNLVLKPGTPTRCHHKIRRLRSSIKETSILFQPWSRRDDDGSQARYQKIMSESPAKIGLFGDFEQQGVVGVSPSKSVRWNRGQTNFQSAENSSWNDASHPPPPFGPRQRAHVLLARGLPENNIDNGVKADALALRSFLAPQSTRNASLLETSPRRHRVQKEQVVEEFSANESSVLETSTTMSSSGSSNTDVAPTHKDVSETLSVSASSVSLIPENAEDGSVHPIDDAVIPDSNMISRKLQYDLINSETTPSEGLSTPHDEVDHVVELWGETMHLASSRSGKNYGSDLYRNFVSSRGSHCQITRLGSTKPPAHLLIASKNASRARLSRENFQEMKQSLASAFLFELDEELTDGRIAELSRTTGGVKLTWTKSLSTTAGRANWRRETVREEQSDKKVLHNFIHYASIDLAEKIIDSELKLLNVLAHEFCHLATFMISGILKKPHGKEFKTWASKCSVAFGERGIHVTTKHSYEINFKYVWQCDSCHLEYKRHSKSIDIQRQRCGSCKGQLEQIRPTRRGKRNSNDGPGQSSYQLFVKEQMQLLKKANSNVLQQDLLQIVAKAWAAKKESENDSEVSKSLAVGGAI
ncbi:hypothetical protein E4U13_008104 [Claviceps humidiphila]|uniref:SprT-like domain-containing protein n=1 Tax=Claviceps humidiphila TaxID=1294629 RepID=A0A9P7PW30_9HYPO|nr:hypothetical protein E4U13_008104 [Claviceps humidiphila]